MRLRLWDCFLAIFYLWFFNKCPNADAGILYFFEVLTPSHLRYSYEIMMARDIGVNFTTLMNRVELVYSDPPHACSEVQTDARNKVLLVERGECSFLSKAIQSEAAGALASIVTYSAGPQDDALVEMVQDETGRRAYIPTVYMPGNHGKMFRKHFLYNSEPVFIKIPLNLTNVPLQAVRKPPWDLW